MTMRQNVFRAFRDLPNLLSLLAFFGATALIFRSVEFALVVTASLGFHELGHAAALAWFGLEWRISFGLVGAWTWSPLLERDRLSQAANALIHLAGPVFSLLLSMAALALNAIWQPGESHLLTLANFSAQVGFLNLLPLGKLSDGGKIVQRMVRSLPRERRPLAILLPLAVTAVMLTLFSLVSYQPISETNPAPWLLGLLLVGLWMGGSLLIEVRRAEAAPKQAAQAYIPVTGGASAAMSASQVYLLTALIWGLLVLSLVISASTPFWLQPHIVLGSMQNLVGLIKLVLGKL